MYKHVRVMIYVNLVNISYPLFPLFTTLICIKQQDE